MHLHTTLGCQRIGIAGLGVTGMAVAALYRHLGYRKQLIGFDNAAQPNQSQLTQLQALDIQLVNGADALQRLPSYHLDVLVYSAGIHPCHLPLDQLRAQGVWCGGELALLDPLEIPHIAITGTNGKSTTTLLVAHLLRSHAYKLLVGGNLGTPLATLLMQPGVHQMQCLVLEVSSYQLDATSHFCPQVAAVLNVTPDHLQRYGDFAHYVQAKQRLVTMMPKDSTLVLNYDCLASAPFAQVAQSRVWWFAAKPLPPGSTGVWIDGQSLRFHGDLQHLPSIDWTCQTQSGSQHAANVAAATLMAYAMGADRIDQLQAAISSFVGLPHRLQRVLQYQGVDYIDDSKATNDAAAAFAISSMYKPFTVLLGGQDKQGGFAALMAALDNAMHKQLLRRIVLFGEARALLATWLAQQPWTSRCKPHTFASMEEATWFAAQMAQPNEVVLLAPAAASLDAYAHFAARGEAFQAVLKQYMAGAGP